MADQRSRPGAAARMPLIGDPIDPARLAWYAGLSAMAALEVIEWPLALAIGLGHAIGDHLSNPVAREAVEGAEAGL